MIPSKGHPDQAKYGNSKKTMSARVRGEAGVNRQNTKDFQGSETIQHNTTIVDI